MTGRVAELVVEGTTASFVALVELVQCRDPDPDAVGAWKAMCSDTAQGPALFRRPTRPGSCSG